MHLRNDPVLKERRCKLRQNQTDAEKMLWKHLRNKQFYGLKFFRQYSIGPYIIDFYCPQLELAIELDGSQHAENDIREYDAVRTDYLKEHRLKVIRFWNNDVLSNINGVLEKITPPSLPLP